METSSNTSKPATFVTLLGNVQMLKTYCSKCRVDSFVIDGKSACCDVECNLKPEFVKRESSPRQLRKKPPPTVAKKILKDQRYRCIYCNNVFGQAIGRKNKARYLALNWDHFVPFDFSQNNNPENFVASCDICNNIKTDKVFSSIEDARDYILKVRQRKGYKGYKDDNEMRVLRKTNSTDKTNEEVLFEHLSDKPQHPKGRSNQNRKTSGDSQTGGRFSKNQRNDSAKKNSSKRTASRKGFRSDNGLLEQSEKIETEYKPDLALVEWLKKYIGGELCKTREVCEFTKKGRTTIDAYVNGKYFAPKERGGHGVRNSNLEKLVRDFKTFVENQAKEVIAEKPTEPLRSITITAEAAKFVFVDKSGNQIAMISFKDSSVASFSFGE